MNLTLKYMFTSFVSLEGDTRHMELYCGKLSGQMEFRNMLFQRFEVT